MKTAPLARLAAVVAIAAAPLTATSAQSATAAPGYCPSSGTVYDPYTNGGVTKTKYWCHNRYGAPVYAAWRVTPDDVDYMYSTYSWFTCQIQADNNPVTRNSSGTYNYNNWWLRTQADTGTGLDAWGWMPATYIIEGGNWQPIPNVPLC